MATALSKSGKSVATWSTDALRERMARMGCDPIEILARIAMGDVPCSACRWTNGRSRYAVEKKQQKPCRCLVEDDEQPNIPNANCWRCDGTGISTMDDRQCQSCHGSRHEIVSPSEIGQAASKLAPYLATALKQVDNISSDGSQVTGIRMILVDAKGGQVQVNTGSSSPRLMDSEE